ncbi:hypothetical protein [Streptomyces sp. NPDC050388]|uniref:hypothetical protein n=1 Tax=Streptomyces sp. NPDC050388 TaxID=3155781 RepID=UPI003434BCB4
MFWLPSQSLVNDLRSQKVSVAQEPALVLTTEWIENPPVTTLSMLITLVFTPLLPGSAVLLVVRRRDVLKAGEQIAAA